MLNDTTTQAASSSASFVASLPGSEQHALAAIGLAAITFALMALCFYCGYVGSKPGKTNAAILHRALVAYDEGHDGPLDSLIQERLDRLIWKYEREPHDSE